MAVLASIAGRPRGGLPAWILGLAVLVCPGAALGQTVAPSQVTPRSLRPPPGPASEEPILPGPAPLQPPPGGEKFDVLVGDVRVEGTFPALAAQTKALVAGIVGRRLTTARIYAFATSLEQSYARAGYPLARVAVPPQHIEDHGRLRILVIDGFIEAVDVRGLPRRVRDAIAAAVGRLVRRRHVTSDEIERALLIASDVPGVTLKSTLAPGTQEGGTRLIVEGEHRLVTGTFGVDNKLPSSLGTWQYGGNLALNSALGFGEQFYATFGLGTDPSHAFAGRSPLAIHGGGVVVPLGSDGMTLNPEYTHSRSETVAGPGLIPSAGEFDRYALRLVDPLIRTRLTDLTVQVSLEHIVARSFVPSLGTDISLDRYTVVRVGPDYTTTLFADTRLEAAFTVSRGLGGRGAANAVPLSTLGAASDFTKVGGTFHVSQPLPGALRLDVIGEAQDAPDKPLLKSEQFSLSSSGAVSAFPDGTFDVDRGATIRAELGRSFGLSAYRSTLNLTPYVFGAAGHGQVLMATQLERPTVDAAALGIGTHGALQADAGTPGATLGVELARQFTDAPGLRRGWRATIGVVLGF